MKLVAAVNRYDNMKTVSRETSASPSHGGKKGKKGKPAPTAASSLQEFRA